MGDELILLDLRLVRRTPPAPTSYARSCGADCDRLLWRQGLEPASIAESEYESDEVAHLTPASPCRVCGALTERWRLVRHD